VILGPAIREDARQPSRRVLEGGHQGATRPPGADRAARSTDEAADRDRSCQPVGVERRSRSCVSNEGSDRDGAAGSGRTDEVEDGRREAFWGYRYRVGGRGSRRVQRGGFQSERDAGEALERALERLRRANGTASTLTLATLVDEYLAQHDAQPETIDKLRWLLAKAVREFGDRRLGELRSQEIAAWRMTIAPGHRFEATQALRQVLARAVAWGMIDLNPAKQGVDNPQRRRTEKRPFESWAQLAAVASRLGEYSGAPVMFAAATGLRPGEWIALERRDIDPAARVVYVRRAYRNGRLKCTKTEGSVRAVPLQEIALDAIARLPTRADTDLLFPSLRGAYFDLHNFRTREWKPSPPNSRPGSHRSDASTICATPSPPSRSVPASQPSISPATWAPA
jgi:integrase